MIQSIESDAQSRAGELFLQPMGARHLDGCAAIVGRLELFRLYHFTEESAKRLLAGALTDARSDLLVAGLGEEVAGFAWFVQRGAFDRSGYLRLIAVDETYRGRGVGQLLMGALEQRHLSQGGITLLASSENAGAHRFYERLGYRHVGEIPDYVRPGLHERIYFKPAPASRAAGLSG